MAKVGLKDTLALLAKGYTKKEIDALAAVDEESEKETENKNDNSQTPDPSEDNKKAQDDAAAKKSNPEPDYKKMYEELLKKQEENQEQIKQKDETIKKIQKDNINSNSLPDLEAQREAEHNSLVDAFRSFY